MARENRTVVISTNKAIGADNGSILLNAVDTTSTGTTIYPTAMKRFFQVVITNSVTVELQGSVDGSTWSVLRQSTASESYEMDTPCPALRPVVTSVGTDGVVSMFMAT